MASHELQGRIRATLSEHGFGGLAEDIIRSTPDLQQQITTISEILGPEIACLIQDLVGTLGAILICPECTLQNPASSLTCELCGYVFHETPFSEGDEYGEETEGGGGEEEEEEEEEEQTEEGETGRKERHTVFKCQQQLVRVPLPEPAPAVQGLDEQLVNNLSQFILSRQFSALMPSDSAADSTDVPHLSDGQLHALMTEIMPNISDLKDRTNTTPLTLLITSTYRSGLPLFDVMPAVRQHSARALRFIFHKLEETKPRSRALPTLQRLADAFQACQAEQGRAIDAIYGTLSGRDKSFKEQIAFMIDDHKERVMEELINLLNPDAWKADPNGEPLAQLPHIRSSYKTAIGESLGLRGVLQAHADPNKFQISPSDADYLLSLYRALFRLVDVLDYIVADLNNHHPEAERLLKPESFFEWAGNASSNNGFESYSIFYDEEKKEQYNGETPQNPLLPFISRQVALQILKALFHST